MYDDYQIMRRCIDRAVTLERHSGRFCRALRRSLPGLHHSIRLPRGDGPKHLTGFAIRYVQAVPDWLERLEILCGAAGLDLAPVRELIRCAFAQPPERHPEHTGLGALLDEAYLAHRTLEEINDQLQPACGTPLLPMDPMAANLVVRELLGEEFAAELDAISVEIGRRFSGLQLSPDSLVALVLRKHRFIETPGVWPDFAGRLDIALRVPLATPQVDTSH
ncbi:MULTISPECIES: hypothetical protein [unclassified Microbulbifer]|uniref:hypothetical protein n=1 Tax=unclassified Microbulbifer TaxID=2619833 RepID=UPI0027E50413|nr:MULTISPECIES: hypothetical protein [unclassified Microbulbifer]